MRRSIRVITIFLVCVLLCTGCSPNGSASSTSEQQSKTGEAEENICFVFSESGNKESTDVLEQALSLNGNVDWVVVNPAESTCALCLSSITTEEFESYVSKLRDNGFDMSGKSDEGIDNSLHTSTNILLTHEKHSISLAYVDDYLTIYLHL